MADTAVKKKKKKKGKKKWIILVVLLLIVAAIFVVPRVMIQKSGVGMSIYTGDLYEITYRDVADTISATGLIESDEDTTKKVYSTLTYKIDTISVSLGDKVNAGDVLCTYETETLDRAIREMELSMTTSQKAAALNLSSAKLNYNTYLAGLNDGTNATLKSAQSAYDSALEKYEDAKEDYEEYLAKNESAEIIALNSAKRAMDNAQKQYDDFKKELDEGTNISLITARRSLVTARDNYETYRDDFEEEDTEFLVSAEAAADKAQAAYQTAKSNLSELKQELKALESDLAEELAKPEKSETSTTTGATGTEGTATTPTVDTQSPSKIERLENAIAELDGEIAALEEKVDELYDQYEAADENYAKVYASAEATLKTYKTTYENALDNYNSTLEKLEDTLDSYEESLISATEKYTDAKEAVDKQIEAYESALSSAERNLSDAENSLTNANINTKNQLESYRIAYETAKNSANTELSEYQLANLYEDLGKTTVTAPISGTITAVYANEGETATGVMFVIEDTENLVITSTVKAYDLDQVSEGMAVEIKTDATGSDVFYGVIESISPTATKDATGSVLSTNDAEFETIVRITDKSDRLRIGVSARIEYVIDQAKDATAVPESAILTDAEGSYVLTVSEDAEGNILLTRTAVEIGVSDGIYTVVSGPDAGTRIADNAENYAMLIGQPLMLSNVDTNASGDMFAAMMQMRGNMMGG